MVHLTFTQFITQILFDTFLFLFFFTCSDRYTLQIATGSTIDGNFEELFVFMGHILGMAVYHGMLIDGKS